MTISDEETRLARIRTLLTRGHAPAVMLGIGDDAAIVNASAPVVITVDTCVLDSHFRRAWLTLRELGRKSFMAAASDLAAMGARPLGAVSSLILPGDLSDEDLESLVLGQRDAADAIGCPIIGGNLSKGPFSITTTCFGETEDALRRDGARAGDLLLVNGAIGCAAAGLRLLENNVQNTHECVDAWRLTLARIDAGLLLATHGAHACIDVSDGFALDLHRMCEASNVGVEVDEAALLSLGGDALFTAATFLGVPALDLALFGGEDYALLASAPVPISGFTIVGKFTADHAISILTENGTREIPKRGHSHF